MLGHDTFASDLRREASDSKINLIRSFHQISTFKEDGNQGRVKEWIKKFRQDLSEALPQFVGFSMQDAHEFLVFFCDYIQTNLAKELESKATSITENFGFKMEETRLCCRCKYESKITKEDMIFRLDLPDTNAQKELHSVQNLLAKTTLGGGLEINCSKCAKGTNETNIHETSDRLKSLPRVLILYMPRSQYSNDTKGCYKNRTQISIDLVIDLKNHVSSDELDKSKISMPAKSPILSSRKRQSTDHFNFTSSPESSPSKVPKLSDEKNEKPKVVWKSRPLKDSPQVINDDKKAKNSPKTPEKGQNDSKDFLSWLDDSPIKTAENPKKNLSKDDVSKMSEEDQLKYAMEQSLHESPPTTQKKYTFPKLLSPLKTPTKPVLSDQDVSRLSEEQLLKYAMKQSLNESFKADEKRAEEEDKSLMEALEASRKSSETSTDDGLPDLDSVDLSSQPKSGDVKKSPVIKIEVPEKVDATSEFEYQLTAVISHTNSIVSVDSGHYIADVYK